MVPLPARRDPMPFEAHCQYLKQISIQVAGGIAAQVRAHNGTAHQHSPSWLQAIAAIENALLDIKAKTYGVPVHALFGGPVRTTLPIYWSHCGNCRVVSGPGKKVRVLLAASSTSR